MINPFVICSTEELATLHQYADRQVWELQCSALGATADQAHAYGALALAYAHTTVYPNTDVVAYLRKLALEALSRGEPMPTDIDTLLNAENARQWVRQWARMARG